VEVDAKISTRVVAEVQFSAFESRLRVLRGDPSLLGHGGMLRDLPARFRLLGLPVFFLTRVLLHDSLKFVFMNDRERPLVSAVLVLEQMFK